MKSFKILPIVFNLILLLFTSCSKNETKFSNIPEVLPIEKIKYTSNIPRGVSGINIDSTVKIYTWEDKKIISALYMNDTILGSRITYIYDSKERLVEMWGLSSDSIMNRLRLYTYNSNDQVIKSIDALGQIDLFIYDENGFLSEMLIFKTINVDSHAYEKVETQKYKYQNGNLISAHIYVTDQFYQMTDELMRIVKYTYDNRPYFKIYPEFSIFDYNKNNVKVIETTVIWSPDLSTKAFAYYYYNYNAQGNPDFITHRIGNLGETYKKITYR